MSIKSKIRKVYKKFLKLFKANDNTKRLVIFVLAFAIVGSLILIASHAASPNVKFEPEEGNVTNPARRIDNDPSASGGGYVRFGATNRSRLGVDRNILPDGVSLATAYNLMSYMGFGMVRAGVFVDNYSNLNPSNFDAELAEAKRVNMKVLVTITYAYGAIGCSNGHCAPKDLAAWGEYTGKLVNRWKTNHPGLVTAVEIWNEANNKPFWDPVDVVKYTELLKRSYTAIKAADPSVKVLFSGPAPGGGNKSADSTNDPANPATFVKQIYANGGKNYFDAGANHPYDTHSLTANAAGQGTRNNFWIRKVMDANGDQAKQLWGTEAGLVSCLDGPGDLSPPMTEAQRSLRLALDLQDFWHGIHDQTTGATIHTNDPVGDYNAGPYILFKLYKTRGDAGLGLIYNTNAYMNAQGNPPNSEAPIGGNPVDSQCKSSPDYYIPGSVADKPGMLNTISNFSNQLQRVP